MADGRPPLGVQAGLPRPPALGLLCAHVCSTCRQENGDADEAESLESMSPVPEEPDGSLFPAGSRCNRECWNAEQVWAHVTFHVT